MKNKSIVIFIIIVAMLVLSVVGKYNTLVSLDETVSSKWAQVENQLKRRADLVPNLVNTIKGYASHEEEVFINVTKARSGLLDAETPSEYSKANAELNKAMTQLNVVVENYPEIKANENFLKLQDELAGTENRLAVARMDYNEEVKRFNSKTRRFPTNIIANMFGFEKKVYFEINEEDAKVPEVNF